MPFKKINNPPTQQEVDRFYSMVKREFISGRWHKIFKGYLNRDGYGRLWFRVRKELAHRVAWYLRYGCWPKQLNHYNFCHIPNCVDIEHMREGSDEVNCLDMRARGNHVSQIKPWLSKKHTVETRRKMSKFQRGEGNPRSKLTKVEVLMIHQLFHEWCWIHKRIAERLYVSRTCISQILSGDSWYEVWAEYHQVA